VALGCAARRRDARRSAPRHHAAFPEAFLTPVAPRIPHSLAGNKATRYTEQLF